MDPGFVRDVVVSVTSGVDMNVLVNLVSDRVVLVKR